MIDTNQVLYREGDTGEIVADRLGQGRELVPFRMSCLGLAEKTEFLRTRLVYICPCVKPSLGAERSFRRRMWRRMLMLPRWTR